MKLKGILSKRNTVVIFIIAIIFFLCGGGKLVGNTISNAVHFFENVFLKEEVKKITFESEDYTESTAGEFKITKSADWIDKNTAAIEFTINSNVMTDGKKRDVIIAIDTSGSMQGEKYEAVKKDATELITKLLEDKNNTVSIIAFSSEAEIKIQQSNNLDELLEIINNLDIVGGTNYYKALYRAEEILTNYEEKPDRECVVIFLTDGFPTTNNHNQIAEFEVLNAKFPNVTIYGIQYEMGIDITQQLKDVTHKQYSINMDELRNVLFDAAFEPLRYEEFELTDYINTEYFYVESAEEVEASIGSASLVNEDGKQKVVWNLSESEYITGTTAKLKIKIKLKDEFISKDGYYPTNEKVEVKASLDGNDKSVETYLTPQLKHGYVTTYDMNEPEGCNLSDLDEETHYAYTTAELSTVKPVCEGYTFQGWETTSKIKYINSDYYIMPTNDVTFKAIWSKFDISKQIEGTVYEKQTLYNLVENEAKNGLLAKEYTGLGSENYQNKVYYYTGQADNNHVLFANYCWKIIRTTDTGGVKLVYDGLPKNGVCNNTGIDSQVNETYVQFNSKDGSAANLGYMYNTRYTSSYITMSNRTKTVASSTVYISQEYTKNTSGNYSLTDPITVTPEEWKSNHENYVGYYACSTPTSSTCSEIRKIVHTEEEAYFYNIIYLYGKSAEYVYDETTQKYVYKLVDPIEITDLRNNMDQLNDRHFTCGTRSDTCASVKYIHHARNTTGIIQVNHITLTNGKTIEEAINEMLHAEDVNTTDSTIKTYVENWYAENMIDYSNFIEDTVYCNDRRIAQPNGWDVNGDPTGLFLFYSNMYRDLTCENKNDRFTVSEEIGNGKLKYPVGLLTATEVDMVGYDILGTDNYYWTMSPSLFSNSSSYIYTMSSEKELVLDNLAVPYKNIPLGVRPVISLKSGIGYISGNGTATNPYVVNSRSLE